MKSNASLALLLPLLLTGCNAIGVWLYGLQTKYDPVTPDTQAETLARFGLEGEPWLELDASFTECVLDSFYARVYNLDSTAQDELAGTANNHLQMLQALYFDRVGRLVSYHVNCYAEGFPNLNWNMDDAFRAFPPASVAPPDSLVSLPALLAHIRDAQGNVPTFDPGQDYTVVTLWPGFGGRQSKRLIRTVKDNLSLAADSLRVTAYFVNDDWFYIHMDSIVQAKQQTEEGY